MELLYCPMCSKAISPQAEIKACPECSHPFNAHEWKEERAKKSAKENEAVLALLRPKDKEHLKTTTKAELINAYKEQKSTGGWTFYNENDIVQRTLENRFNFLIIAYSLFLAAYFQPYIGEKEKIAILIIGLIIISFLSIALYRTKNRFNITLDIVHSLEQNDVSPVIHRENERRHDHWFNKYFRKNSIQGFYIPLLMMASFVVGLIYHFFVKGVTP